MSEFWKSCVLLLIGVAAGTVPTVIFENMRSSREASRRRDDLIQETLVGFLSAARDVRHGARLLAAAKNESQPGAGSRAELRVDLDEAMGRFQHTYHELSILADAKTYAAARELNSASLALQLLVEEGGVSNDPAVAEARAACLDRRRDLRDLVRRERGLDDLGTVGRKKDHRLPTPA